VNTPSKLASVRQHLAQLNRPVKIMEVCGTHTMSAFRSGLRSLLGPGLTLLSGPGCPVCVTPITYIDRALALAGRPQTLIATFGDMLRVPGTRSSLEHARAQGADIRIFYSPQDALETARNRPELNVVFLGVGFETTAVAVAWTIQEAARLGLSNYSVFCAHKTMPPAMAGLLASGEVAVDGFLCPGHVSVVIGANAYAALARDYGRPCVVAGFEAADMAQAIDQVLQQLLQNRAQVEIQYQRSVTWDGNASAQSLLAEVFEPCDAEWRGLGLIPGSGLKIRPRYAACDAERVFSQWEAPVSEEPRGCRCGDVLRGACTPPDCPLFRNACSPSHPVGACMVSSEGTCSAYYKYGK